MKTYSLEDRKWNKDGLESMYGRESYTGIGETNSFDRYEKRFDHEKEDVKETVVKIRRHCISYTY